MEKANIQKNYEKSEKKKLKAYLLTDNLIQLMSLLKAIVIILNSSQFISSGQQDS